MLEIYSKQREGGIIAHEKAKVYFDGSHYIAIPHTESPTAKKSGGTSYSIENDEKKKAFETAYKGTKAKKRKEKFTEIVAGLRPQFESKEKTAEFVTPEMERILRNLIVRRTRLARKINLGNWNYFCTFTYDDKKHTEDSFKKSLRNCFKKMCYRKGWVYIGVFVKVIKALTAKGVLYKGKPFAKNTIYGILKNEKYSGVYYHGDERVDNMYPQIVHTHIFEAVRAKVDKNKYGKRSVKTVYLFRHKMKCGYCGHPISADTGTARNGEVKRYYKCLGRKVYHNSCEQMIHSKEAL